MSNPALAIPAPTVNRRQRSRFLSPAFWAAATAALTFPLIWVGGLVTTHDAGMAVPDWPGTYGYNLLLYPLSWWLSGPFDLFAEHGHRLLGAMVGLLSIAVVVSAYGCSTSSKLRWASIALLLAIIAQGVLGGVRVLAIERYLALIHGCTGPLVFLLAIYVAILARRERQRQHVGGRDSRSPTSASSSSEVRLIEAATPRRSDEVATAAGVENQNRLAARRVQRWAMGLCLLAFVQLVIGANLRHAEASLPPAAFMGLTHTHLLLAAILLVSVTLFAAKLLWNGRHLSLAAGRWSVLLLTLIVGQVVLGLGTWFVNYALPWQTDWPTLAGHVNELKGFAESMIVTAHQATGSLILAVLFVVAMKSQPISPSAPSVSPDVATAV